MKRTDRILTAAILLAALLSLSLLAAGGDFVPQENPAPVATDGTSEYFTLAEAIAGAPDGATVTMLASTTAEPDSDAPYCTLAGKALTLDLAGKTVTLDMSGPSAVVKHMSLITVAGDGELTLTDSTDKKEGTLTVLAPQVYATSALLDIHGKLTVESGNVKGLEKAYYLINIFRDTETEDPAYTGPTLIVNGGVLDNAWGTADDGGVLVGVSGTRAQSEGAYIEINGGTLSGGEQTLYLASAGETVIRGGTLRGIARVVELRAGKLTVEGGSFTTDAARKDGAAAQNGGTGKYTGTLVLVKPAGASADAYHGAIDVAVTGGSFVNEHTGGDVLTVVHESSTVPYTAAQDMTLALSGGSFSGGFNLGPTVNNAGHAVPDVYGTDTLAITGGSYTLEPSAFLSDAYFASLAGGFYTVARRTEAPAAIGGTTYSTLAAALESASGGTAASPVTVTVLRDTSLAQTVSLAAEQFVTLDLAGRQVGVEAQLVLDGGSLRITGGTMVSTILRPLRVFSGRLTLGSVRIVEDSGTVWAPLLSISGSKEKAATAYSVVTVEEDASLVYADGQYGYGILIAPYKEGTSTNNAWYGVELTVAGTIDTNDTGSPIYINGNIKDATVANMGDTFPRVTVKETAVLTGSLYGAGYANWTIEGGSFTGGSALSIKSGTWRIKGGTFTAFDPYFDPARANGNGSELTGAAISITSNDGYGKKIDVHIEDGLFISQKGFALYEGIAQKSNGQLAAAQSFATVTVEGGRFAGNDAHGAVSLVTVLDKAVISGGHFTSDPTAFLVAGKLAVPGTVRGYAYTVADKVTGVEVAPAPSSAKLDEAIESAESDVRAAAQAAAAALADNADKTTASGLEGAAGSVAQAVDAQAMADGAAALKDAVGEFADNVTIYVRPYLDITVLDAAVETSDLTALTLDIRPMVKTLASTAETADAVVETGTGQNAVTLGTPQELTVNAPVTVTLPLPAGYVSSTSDEVFIHHLKDGNTYVYKAVLTLDGGVYFATFHNPHGFSTFLVTREAAASISRASGVVYYASLQSAVNDVANGEQIALLEAGETATVGRTVRFTVSAAGKAYTIEPGAGRCNASGQEGVFDIVRMAGDSTAEQPVHLCAAYTDIASHWGYANICAVIERGMMNGVNWTTFAPDRPLTRAMLAAILYRLEGSPTVTAELRFADVPGGTWYTEEMRWAISTAVIGGFGDGTARPLGALTREQLAIMLHRYAGYKGYAIASAEGADLSGYVDAADVSWFAADSLAWAKAVGLIEGRGNVLAPTDGATRAEGATILMRFLALVED